MLKLVAKGIIRIVGLFYAYGATVLVIFLLAALVLVTMAV